MISNSNAMIHCCGTRTRLSDSVGTRLIIRNAISTVHAPITSGADHQPAPNSSHTTRGASTSSAPAGDGTPTKNSVVNTGLVVSSSRVLNLASRSTTHTTKTSATDQ